MAIFQAFSGTTEGVATAGGVPNLTPARCALIKADVKVTLQALKA